MDTSTAAPPSMASKCLDEKQHQLLSTRIPKSFSIESIISTRNSSHQTSDSPPLANTCFPNPAAALFPANFCLPPLQHSIYSPWMSYLAAASVQHQHQHHPPPPINQSSHYHPAYQLFANNFVENSDREPSMHSFFGPSPPHIDPRFALAAVDPEHREQLAQLFANNVRDPKLTEFLLGQRGIDRSHEATDYHTGIEDDRSGSDGTTKDGDNGEMGDHSFGHRVGRVRDLSELYFRGQRMLSGDVTGAATASGSDQLDMDSAESGSELSMTMSPEGQRKSAGKRLLAIIFLPIISSYNVRENKICLLFKCTSFITSLT